MSDLEKSARLLLEFLITRLNTVEPGQPQTYVSYKQVHEALGLEFLGRTYGESLKRQGLVSLADWTARETRPAITGLIINRETQTPGAGYFRLFGKSENDFSWWAAQIRLSKEFDWQPDLRRSSDFTLSGETEGDSDKSVSRTKFSEKDWSRQEVEETVNDYMQMLLKETSRESYSKADHRRRLLGKLIGRSKGAVEYKHQNISAVLVRQGLPYIDGYKPARNYQNLLTW